MESGGFQIFIEICVCLSAFSELLLIYGFISVPEIRKYPGKFILAQSIFQFFLDLHWLSSLNNLGFLHNEQTCKVIGALCIAFEIQAWLCNLYICLEVVQKLKNPKSLKRKRFKIYVVVSVVFFVFTVLTLSLGSQSGLSDIKTCSIQYRSYYNVFQIFTLLFFVPTCMSLALWCLNKGKTDRLLTKTLRYHIYVVITFTFSLLPSMINGALSFPFSESSLKVPVFLEVTNNQISVTLGSLSGFFTFIARMWQKGLTKLYFKALCCFITNKTRDSFKVSLLDLNPYTSFFDTVEKNDDIKSIIKCIEFSYKFPKTGQITEQNDIQWFYIEKSRKMKILKKNPKVFSQLKKIKKFSNDLEIEFEGIQDLTLKQSEEEPESINFTCLSNSKKFRIICVSLDDFLNFSEISKAYTTQAEVDHSNLLAILDLYSITLHESCTVQIMIAENPVYPLKDAETQILIDAKGHIPEVPNNLSGSNSFIGLNQKLKITQKDLNTLQKQILSDTRVLSKFNFLSYSLILCQSEIPPLTPCYTVNGKASIFYLEPSFNSHSASFFNKTNYRDEFLNAFSQLFLIIN